MRQRARALYKRNQVEGATAPQLIVMLYGGAVRFLAMGSEGLKEGKGFTETSHHVLKAMNILAELMGCLNPEASRQIADCLLNLYSYMLDRLALALRERDPAPIEEVIGLLKDLEGAWVEAEKRWAEGKPREAPPRQAGISL